jgi:SnoaL-like domain
MTGSEGDRVRPGNSGTAGRISDRMAIEDLVRRYAQGIDQRNWSQVDSCFTPEAVIRGTRSSGIYPDYIAALRPSVERFGTTMHYVTNQLTHFTGEHTAETVAYAMAYHLGSGDEDFVIGVRYHDNVGRIDGDWRITGRVVEGIWQRPTSGDVRPLR